MDQVSRASQYVLQVEQLSRAGQYVLLMFELNCVCSMAGWENHPYSLWLLLLKIIH
jgi:hypothetical protein